MQTDTESRNQEISDEELEDTLIAISVVAKRLAKKVKEERQAEKIEKGVNRENE